MVQSLITICISNIQVMKKMFFLPIVIILFFSCEKEDPPFLPEYQIIPGTWAIQSISYDSSGVRITKALPYDKLVITDNLEYSIYYSGLDNPIENGTINIINQSNDRLELYFVAKRPAYSSYAGSYVFGITNVELVSLSEIELIFRTINAGYDVYSDKEIFLER